MSANTVFDHLNLDASSRRLIVKACGDPAHMWLAPLDKGLSGSTVWLARWQLASGAMTKHHVLKIGTRSKLKREFDAMNQIASTIQRGFPHVALCPQGGRALLRQEFVGKAEGDTVSLRHFMQNCTDEKRAASVIDRLYRVALRGWYKNRRTVSQSFDKTLDWWLERVDLRRAASDLGPNALDYSLIDTFGTSFNDLRASVNRLRRRVEPIVESPVHGDLHAQNVLVDARERLHLIDYGWTAERWSAIDFLMLECSLKFVASPPHARLEDLLLLERVIDRHASRRSSSMTELRQALLGKNLAATAAAVIEVRRSALTLQTVADEEQYRRGLVLLTAALATLPALINRVYLFHSLAYYCSNADY